MAVLQISMIAWAAVKELRLSYHNGYIVTNMVFPQDSNLH